MAQLTVGFILARRFTLCAFANFVDVLRLAADEGDRSRPILCAWRVLSPTMEPIASSSGISVQPDERLGDPARFDYLVVVGGLVDEIENLHPDTVRFLKRAASARECRWSASAPGRSFCTAPASCAAIAPASAGSTTRISSSVSTGWSRSRTRSSSSTATG